MSTGTTPRIIDNRYILDEDWREGGTARVYRAFDRKEHRTVAVKILARELNPDERLVNRVFDREQRSLSASGTRTSSISTVGGIPLLESRTSSSSGSIGISPSG